jgi:hypothetical protein
MSEHNDSRRKFIKAAAYTAPVILTLKAMPSYACSGSMRPRCGSKTHKTRVGSNRPRMGSNRPRMGSNRPRMGSNRPRMGSRKPFKRG